MKDSEIVLEGWKATYLQIGWWKSDLNSLPHHAVNFQHSHANNYGGKN